MTRVLLVTNDRRIADRLADVLEAQHDEVMVCPGPQPPSYVCVGVCKGRCALSDAADVVVVDGWLASDANRKGVPSWHLLRYYRELGRHVVALIGPDGLPARIDDPDVVCLPREATTAEIAAAVSRWTPRGRSA